GKDGQDYRSLKAEDDILTITLERALALLSEPKRTKGGSRSSSKKPLRELGVHPEDKEPVNIYEGPYGIYIKHGKINAGIPEGETVESITLEKALKLLSAKAATKKTTRKATQTTSKTTKTTKTTRTTKTTKK
ncbi:MAG: topoisomerase C-terminal repeat-containing protein, partial [Microcystaceae cyanobacterium]